MAAALSGVILAVIAGLAGAGDAVKLHETEIPTVPRDHPTTPYSPPIALARKKSPKKRVRRTQQVAENTSRKPKRQRSALPSEDIPQIHEWPVGLPGLGDANFIRDASFISEGFAVTGPDPYSTGFPYPGQASDRPCMCYSQPHNPEFNFEPQQPVEIFPRSPDQYNFAAPYRQSKDGSGFYYFVPDAYRDVQDQYWGGYVAEGGPQRNFRETRV